MPYEPDLLELAAAWRSEGRQVAVATVVATWGSSPRPPGSQLLADDTGRFLGSVSEGCINGSGVQSPYAALTGIRAVNDPDAVNLTQVVLHGTRLHSDLGEQFMPAFGKAYSDAEIAAMVNYVTGRFGARAATITPVQVARHREQE